MPTTNVNNVNIAYTTYGSVDDPVILLIMGLGLPAAAWPPLYIDDLVARGHRVVTFDNRDIGESQLFDDKKPPNLLWQLIRDKLGLRVKSEYLLADMADDSLGVLDALQIDAAHVVGASMGGMIAQLLALNYPERVLSLTSIMSTTGARDLPEATKEVKKAIVSGGARARTREQRLAHFIKIWKLIGSPAYPASEEQVQDLMGRLVAAGITSDGTARQLLAIAASPDRTPRLPSLAMPTLVLHGEEDPLVPVECGRATAAAAKSEIVTFPGMGHDLPEQLRERICGLISDHMQNAVALKN